MLAAQPGDERTWGGRHWGLKYRFGDNIEEFGQFLIQRIGVKDEVRYGLLIRHRNSQASCVGRFPPQSFDLFV